MSLTAPGPGPRLPRRPPDERRRRRGRLGAVLLAVLLMHAWLIGPIRTPLGRPPIRLPTIQLVNPTPAAAPLPANDQAAPSVAEPAPPPPLPAPQPDETPTPPSPPDDRPIDWLAGPRPPEYVTGTGPETDEPAPSAPAAPAPGLVGDAGSDSGGPPPVYRTVQPTQPFKLDYRVERGDDAGVGALAFELDPSGHYVARFFGVIDKKALVDLASRGGFDSAGLAPQRMAERSRGMDVRAANFQRDRGVISFSSSTRSYSLFDGAQDRVSVLLQLMAIAEAQPGGLRPGQQIRLQVASPRGQAGEWMFEVLGDEQIEPNGAPIATVHLRREPIQPYDQRVEVWLAREAGHLPVGLRFTQVPGKESTAYWLSGRLPALAAHAASAARP